MEPTDDKKMIAEMSDFLADKAKANKKDDPKAEENLPFESIDSYSTDPVGFGEMSLRMLNKVEFVFDLAAKDNRFSSKYLKRCTQLEKGIKYLGSLCVTKYALQTQGQSFPQLGQLSTEKLYCMTSHHFRKLDMAVTEYMFEHRDVPDKLFDMEMRYFNLLERLRSTEVKIEKFHDRYIFGPEDYSPIIHGMAFSGKNKTRSIVEKYDEAPAFRHAPAFGLLAEAGGLNKKSEIINKMPSSSNEEGRMKKEEASPSTLGPVPLDQFSPAHEVCPGELIPVAPSEDTDEQVSGVGDQGSEVTAAPDLEGTLCRRGLTPSVTDTPESLPPCLEIMKRVMERSRESDDGSLTFTIEEMEFLAADPLFARLDPRLAADIRKILEAGPPG